MNIQKLKSKELASQLRLLVGSERNVQVDFLLHLAEFDHRRQFLDEGCASLWRYCEKKLGYRDGAIFIRITAARLLRRFPSVADYLRDGRLSMTSLADLREVLAEENATRLFDEASGKSSDEVRRIARTILPVVPRKSGIRKLPQPRIPELVSTPTPTMSPPPTPTVRAAPATAPRASGSPNPESASPRVTADVELESTPTFALVPPPPALRRAKIEPVSGTKSQIVMVVDVEFLARLKRAQSILSNTIPNGDLAAIFSKGVDLILEKHANRVGPSTRGKRAAASARANDATPTVAVESARESASTTDAKPFAKPVSFLRKAIPAAVFKAVWERDGGRCQWPTGAGHVCGSDFQLQADHEIPVAWGGASTVENVRILCRAHNIEHARRCFGAIWMDRFRRDRTSAGRSGDVADRPPENRESNCDGSKDHEPNDDE